MSSFNYYHAVQGILAFLAFTTFANFVLVLYLMWVTCIERSQRRRLYSSVNQIVGHFEFLPPPLMYETVCPDSPSRFSTAAQRDSPPQFSSSITGDVVTQL